MPNYKFNHLQENKVYKTINSFDYKNIVLTDEAQSVTSNFRNGNVVFRNERIDSSVKNIEALDKNIIFRNANLYGLLRADKVLDMPTSGTYHRMIDYDIPFIHLVFNGYLDYANPSFNLNTSKSIHWHKLKAIETGARVQFTLSYHDTVNLIKTDYSHYYSTYYKNWINDVNNLLIEIDELEIYNA